MGVPVATIDTCMLTCSRYTVVCEWGDYTLLGVAALT